MTARRAAIRATCKAAALPLWAADMVTVRGKCRGRVKRRPCTSRWGVVRVSLDFTGENVDRLATVECGRCGRTWQRCKVPARLTSAAGYQTTRLTLILPRSARRWFIRGRWHRDGEDATVLRDATIGDLSDAATAHRTRAERLDRARSRRRAIADAEAIDSHRRVTNLLAAIAERDAADEAAAAAREAAMA